MRLRVATLNVWGLPSPFARDLEIRMAALGRRLSEMTLDLVAFQEVWTGDAQRTLRRAGERAGLEHAWHPGAGLGGGLLILSRLPFEDVQFERFEWRGHAEEIDRGEYLGGKGFARVRVRTEAGPLWFVATHLHARYGQTRSHGYRAHRTAQVVELSHGLIETSEPVLVVGDFNTREGDPEYAIFTGLTGARDVAAELDRREPTVFRANPYRKGRKTDARKDFIFARDGRGSRLRPLRVERIFDRQFEVDGHTASYSDHAGLRAELDLHPGPFAAIRPDPAALEMAARLLREGRRDALRRRSDGRLAAGIGLGVAVAAAGGARADRISRRRLLRRSLEAAAVLALTPGVGFSVLSELFVSEEIRAFDDVSAQLAQLGRDAGGALPS